MSKKLTVDEKITRIAEKETARWQKKFRDDSLTLTFSFRHGFVDEGSIRLYSNKDEGNPLIDVYSHRIHKNDAIASSLTYFAYPVKEALKRFYNQVMETNYGIESKLRKLKL